MRHFTEERVIIFVTILLAGDHNRRGGAGWPQVFLLIVKLDTYRNALCKADPFQIRIDGRHAFVVARAAGIGDPCRNAIDSPF